MTEKTRILIINSNIELIDALEEWLKAEGCVVKSVQALYLKNGKINLIKLLRSFKPHAVLYDVAIPYGENWEFFKNLINLKDVDNIRFVLTTTNKRVLEYIVGPTDTTEIIGKPFEIEEMNKIIKSGKN